MDAVNLFAELKRRRVFRVLVGYGIVSFAVLQIVEPIMHALHLPDVTLTYVVLALAVGFPVAVVLAWAFDVNEGRIERTAPATALSLKGAWLPLLLVGVGLLAAAPGIIWYFVLPGHLKGTQAPPTVAAVTPSIAVLPFADMSPGKDQEYFSDGIAEEILNALAHVENLRVIGRTSSFSFKGKNEDLRTIGQKLNVGSILEGSVRKSGDAIRITTQLINAVDGSHVWSEMYDRKLTDVFAVQDEIAKAVVGALKVKLLAGKPRRGTNPEAYAQFLIGNSLARQATSWGGATTPAAEAFKRALALDPEFAPAWAGLAVQHVMLTEGNGFDFDQEAPSVEQSRAAVMAGIAAASKAAEKAITLAPEEAEGYDARAMRRLWLSWDWDGAQADIERALALAPGNADAHRRRGQLLMTLGNVPAARDEFLRSTDLDPLSSANWAWLSDAEIWLRHFDAAEHALQRSLGLISDSAPDFYVEHMTTLSLRKGDTNSAARWADKFADPRIRDSWKAAVEYSAGRTAHAREMRDSLLAKIGNKDPYGVAQLDAWLGDRDAAFDFLDQAHARHVPWLRDLKYDTKLESLHSDPRWPALLKKMNLPLD